MRGAALESLALLALGVLLPVVGFHGAAKDRTLIPLALHHEVLAKDLQHEKKPGVDDACRLRLRDLEDDGESLLRVECAVFHAVETGAVLRKEAGDRLLEADGERLALEASRDAEGAEGLLGCAVLPPLLALVWAWKRREE